MGLRWLLVVAVLVGGTGCPFPPEGGPLYGIDPGTTSVLTDVCIWDGETDQGCGWQLVVQGEELIAAVQDLPDGFTGYTDVLEALRLEGQTDFYVLPGLIDALVYLTESGTRADVGTWTAEALTHQLAAGVTSVVDAGGPDVRDLRSRIDNGGLVGPRILRAGGQVRMSTGTAPCEHFFHRSRCHDVLASGSIDEGVVSGELLSITSHGIPAGILPDDDANPAEVYYRRSVSGGVFFGAVQALSDIDGHQSAFPRFHFSGATGNRLAIAWRDGLNGSDWDAYVAVSNDGGASWLTPVAAAGGSGDQWDPMATVDADGAVHVGFMNYALGVGSAAPPRVYYLASADGQTWDSGDIVELGETRSRFPHLLYDADRDVLWYFAKDEGDITTIPDFNADIFVRYSLDGGAERSDFLFVTDEGDDDVGFQGYTLGPDGELFIVYNQVPDGAGPATPAVQVVISRSSP